MTPQELIAAFDALADAPDGVARLRELVLQLAVRGKLVAQDPAEEPGSVAVREAEAAQASLVAAKSIPSPLPISGLGASDVPHDIPEAWCWARLGQVVAVLDFMRRPVRRGERELRVAGKPKAALFPYYGATRQAGWIDEFIFDEELVLLGEDGAPFFKPDNHVAYVASGRYWVNNHAHVLRGLGLLNSYLCHVLNQTSYVGLVSGTTRLKLTQRKMVQIPIPVPPLAEQQRIVARVDELMGLLDRLEAAKERRDTTRGLARDSTLDALRSADTHDEVRTAWGRFAEQIDDLVCDPVDIPPLRQTVLELAVRGKLVAQDPADEPASVLLGRIAEEKARLVAEKEIRKPKVLPPVTAAETLYRVPDGWIWARFGCVQVFTNGYAFKSAEYVSEGVGIVRMSNLDDGNVTTRGMKRVPVKYLGELSENLRVRPGDLLIGMSGSIGQPAFNRTDETFLLNQRVGKITPVLVCAQYLAAFLRTTERHYLAIASGSAIANLSTAQIAESLIPLPPLAEQHRIVARVDELMGLIDRIETGLISARDAQAEFAAAVVHHCDV